MEALHENTQLAFVDDVIRGRYECLQQLTKYPVKELEVVRFHLRLSASRLAPDSHWNEGDRERTPGWRTADQEDQRANGCGLELWTEAREIAGCDQQVIHGPARLLGRAAGRRQERQQL